MAEELNWEQLHLERFPKGSREIGIFELAELFGISSEALRKYESKGVLQPHRGENKYRKYSSWDLTKIIRLRQLRQEGFSLESISDELSRSDPQRQLRDLEKKQQTLTREIDDRRRLITWLDSQREELSQFQSRGQTCVLEHLPRQYCCVYMVGDTLVDKTGKDLDHLKEWMQALPFARVYHVVDAGTPASEALSCLSLREDELKLYGLKHLKPDFILPEGSCAVCSITAEASPNHDTSNQVVLQAHVRVEELELPLSGQAIIQMVWYTQKEGIFQSHNKAMFPLTE